MRPRDSANWSVINHAPFDGDFIDSFQETSLHLCLTKYNRPIDVGVHGVRDSEIYFLEAFVKVCFKDHWIGDANILSSLEKIRISLLL